MSITPRQCRAARALLGWTQDDLAAAASAGRRTCIKFENGEPVAARTIVDLTRALEAAGVLLLADDGELGDGVRLTKGATVKGGAPGAADDQSTGR